MGYLKKIYGMALLGKTQDGTCPECAVKHDPEQPHNRDSLAYQYKENAKIKTVYEALQPIDGKCPDCGAWIDEGQHSIRINGYVDIYKGALNLIEDVVQQVNEILDYLEVDTKIDGETPYIQLYTSEIIRSLFVPYVGGTSRCNMKKALDIKEDELKFEIKAERMNGKQN